MESPYIDLFESNEKNRLLKSLSSNNFGSTYIYNLMNLKRINIKTARTPNKSYQNFNFKISSRNKNGLSQEYLYFSNVKNKKVRNIYETILKNSCREKEPRMIHLKNLFRIKRKTILLNIMMIIIILELLMLMIIIRRNQEHQIIYTLLIIDHKKKLLN